MIERETTIFVPSRRDNPKSRLPERCRAALAAAMLDDVVSVCRRVAPTVVVREPGGLNAAVENALRGRKGPVAVVNGDVPAVTAEDVVALIGAVPLGGLAFAPAADGTVNALALDDASLFRPLYGPGSAARFAACRPSLAVDLPNLTRDVDVLTDLDFLRGRLGTRTRRFPTQTAVLGATPRPGA